ncbi:MAG TPA: ParB/RepB/Spo0J family partition protein [Bacteroidales bacterium]|nr:ParB/RepB/Spo0J family partition protein [Bacteroidales bacterium]
MARKNALGRGLGALIDADDERDLLRDRLSRGIEISVDRISTNPRQPRTKFDDDSLEELAESMKQIGIIQPITVRESNDGNYQLITGERRLRAAKIAGIGKIPAYIRGANDSDLLEMALVENIQREDLDAIEIAISFQRLIDECNLTQEDLSQRVGKKRTTISNYIRLLKLPAEIQIGIREKKISMGHARAIINIEDPKEQLDLYYRIVKHDLSVRKVEDLVRKLTEKKEEPVIPDGEKTSLPQTYEELKNHLSKFFNTNVDFKRNNKGAGKIVIPFVSDDDLERIIAIFDSLRT